MQNFMVPQRNLLDGIPLKCVRWSRTAEASTTGGASMPTIVSDLALFTLVAAFSTGIVIAAASLLN